MGVFRFKGFSIKDDHTPMKVGMDAVMLGAWVGREQARTAMDVGCGSGVITLMLAYRFPDLHIEGIDIHSGALADARDNLLAYSRPHKVQFYEADFLNYQTEKKFDLIVSNPPFLLPTKKTGQAGRDLARFSDALPPDRFIEQAAQLLTAQGRVAVVLPSYRQQEFLDAAYKHHLKLKRHQAVRHREQGKAKRVLIELSKSSCKPSIASDLLIKDAKNQYTEEYRQLTGAFYLRQAFKNA